MSSQEPYYCMQIHNEKGIHCSLNTDERERVQCKTCHDIAREKAEAEHRAYHGPYNKKLLPPPVDKDPLEEIAKLCQSLTYGQMVDLQSQLEKHMLTAKTMAETINLWSKNYGMDSNNTDSSSSDTANIDVAIDNLLKSDKRET